ncbi:MAG: tRNA (N(6)-L-threonylcarbamoyladenosine(37)-C(2))-methylthiotransferase MtaB [Acidobacteria bacterium]|nr:tRNA (N(6)-L-threonylcarbamoyladenosine(37)-C(2))-methylthiotransferase MtaB [Acidobacteriota bacterium]
MKYAVVTFGCRVNQADSLVIEEQLRSRGAVNASPEDADLVIVNTCSVTASADQGARQTIRRIARSNPDVEIVVTGCYASRQPADIAALPNVVHIVPNSRKDDFDFVTTALRFGDGEGACGSSLAPGVAGRTALTLRVQTGCEEQCSYCIIPQTRGAGRSRPLAAVVSEVRRAADAGYKEIAITGVHLGSYGRDLNDGSSLTALVRALSGWPDDVLFRISSLEPMDCTPDIVELVASSPRLAPHFHLPLQHGSDVMLRAMRRPYTVAYYQRLVDSIRIAIPHASIGSDIIVGFPGEDADHFEEMRGVLERLPLTHLHVFPYSDRPGTAATRLQPKVDGGEIRERGRQVRAIGERMAKAFKASQVGRTLRALTVDDGRSAVTENYLKLRLDEARSRNEWINVGVTPEMF